MQEPSHATLTDRRTTLKHLVAVGAGFGVGGTVPGVVDGEGSAATNPSCDLLVPAEYSSIQAAVDSASAGDTICVGAGTYPEQILIDKSIALRNVPGTTPTIQPDPSPTAVTIPESGPAWEPMVFAYGGSESGGTITGSATISVSISGFEFDGSDRQPAARRKPGILYRNASGSIAETSIHSMGLGGKETFGIVVYGDSNVTIADNTIREYERGGIGVNGDGGSHPSPTADIRNNVVDGSTGIGRAWGPNGIQIGFGADGHVRNNVVRNNRYSTDSAVAAGILVFESDGVGQRGNVVENADVGLAAGCWGWFAPSADTVRFVDNTVRDCVFGSNIEVVALQGVSQYDPSVSNCKVVNNELADDETTADPDGLVGSRIVTIDADDHHDPVAKNNKLIRNSITGFETDVVDGGTETKVRPIGP